MNRYKVLLPILALSLISFSCQQDVFFDPEPEILIEEPILGYDGVEEALWIYFDRFEEEAQKRGLSINLRASNISGEIIDLGDEDVAGQCTYNSHLPNHVSIDLSFWNEAPDLYKEFVVFHELGHCELARDHRDEATENGICVSLMRSGLGDCRDNYNTITRAAYLDELFDPRFFDEI